MKDKDFLAEIWVYCETKEASLTIASKELLGKAKMLAQELHYSVAAILFATAEKEAASYGADIVYQFAPCREEDAADAIAMQMQQGRPWAFLFPATARGRMAAAMLSVECKTGLTADCIALAAEDGFLKQTRPAFGGSLMADILCRHSYPQMATVQKGVFPLPLPHENASAEVIKCGMPERSGAAIERLQWNAAKQDQIMLGDAKIVLAGGMGLGTKENFALLERAAKKIGAAPAASRAAVNAGLAPYDWQVGQSGKTIRPELYIACGISGAVQHLSGIQGAGCIFAVNLDQKAPIFHHADFGIAADCAAFLRQLLDAAD